MRENLYLAGGQARGAGTKGTLGSLFFGFCVFFGLRVVRVRFDCYVNVGALFQTHWIAVGIFQCVLDPDLAVEFVCALELDLSLFRYLVSYRRNDLFDGSGKSDIHFLGHVLQQAVFVLVVLFVLIFEGHPATFLLSTPLSGAAWLSENPLSTGDRKLPKQTAPWLVPSPTDSFSCV